MQRSGVKAFAVFLALWEGAETGAELHVQEVQNEQGSYSWVLGDPKTISLEAVMKRWGCHLLPPPQSWGSSASEM